MPNVHFGISDVETGADITTVVDGLQTDLEDIYIFKKSESMLAYTTLDSTKAGGKKSIVYSAIQVKVINALLDIRKIPIHVIRPTHIPNHNIGCI